MRTDQVGLANRICSDRLILGEGLVTPCTAEHDGVEKGRWFCHVKSRTAGGELGTPNHLPPLEASVFVGVPYRCKERGTWNRDGTILLHCHRAVRLVVRTKFGDDTIAAEELQVVSLDVKITHGSHRL